jgi:hypothetical protein
MWTNVDNALSARSVACKPHRIAVENGCGQMWGNIFDLRKIRSMRGRKSCAILVAFWLKKASHFGASN